MPDTPPDVQLFDFRAPPRLPPARQAGLTLFATRFAASLRSLLTPRMREVVDAQPAGMQLATPAEAVAAMAGPAIRYAIDLGDSRQSRAVLEIPEELATRFVDRLCGGPEELSPGRALTVIEHSVLGELFERTLPMLAAAFIDVVTVAPRQRRLITAEIPVLAAPGQHVVLLRFDMRCGPASGMVVFAFPLVAFDQPAAADAAGLSGAALIEQHLLAVTVPVTARISFRIAALDIASMREGGTLNTGHSCHGPVDVYASGRRQFAATLGRDRGHVGVRVVRAAALDDSSSRSNRRMPSS